MKNTLLIILSCIALGLLFLKWQYRNATPTTVSSPSPVVTPSPVADLTAGWPPFDTEFFSLRYPPEATAGAGSSGPDSEEWRVFYMGDIQKKSGRTQTELFDGYAITITKFETVGGEPRLQAEADRQSIIDGCGVENVTAINEAVIGKLPALSFEGGCLGTANHYYLEAVDSLYRITILIEKPTEQPLDYERITSGIMDSIEFK